MVLEEIGNGVKAGLGKRKKCSLPYKLLDQVLNSTAFYAYLTKLNHQEEDWIQ